MLLTMKLATFERSLWLLALTMSWLGAADAWLVLEGRAGAGRGKHIVLISGDEEYRSEEALPQLAKILARRHGFKCTVLFAIDANDGSISPNQRDNIPGLETLASADLMVIATRWRDLPDGQMKHIVEYVESGRPIIGLRTATHAFDLKTSATYRRYTWNSKEWDGGFGRRVLGETWIAHHGHHGKQSTRGILVEQRKKHPILRGIKDGSIWGPTDVYKVSAMLPGGTETLVLGQVLQGMHPDDPPAAGAQNEPMMPIAWTRTYTGSKGRAARVFTTTMGSSQDLENEAFRKMLINAAYWAVGMEEKIKDRLNVALVGEYKPSPFKFGGFKRGVKPSDLAVGF